MRHHPDWVSEERAELLAGTAFAGRCIRYMIAGYEHHTVTIVLIFTMIGPWVGSGPCTADEAAGTSGLLM